ncbi:hypothetical protein H489_0109815 [Curtobacterium flaccumfaciens UCD-AKU]|uniref:hypothetical protein n=1 Tax=Curtobacterium flaccumfaciens TaxID=2035 RepID=UPI0003752A67|nr:hypothetical protein [Curtobacterium flaccumfaciens]EYT63960.1 hypothetical protein H489_0109815 [Curtobacterium flaccumfaciens UCD-AKU]
MANEPMNLDQALRASYADALTLGVRGIGADALARRAEVARAVLAEQSRRVDAAYRGVAGAEPDVPALFGATLVLRHGGDLNGVLGDPMFAATLQQQMGLGYGAEYVNDEDGARWESIEPTAEDNGQSAAEVTRIRSALAELGSLDPGALQAETAADRLPLQERMEQAFLEGYGARLQVGLAYAAADDAARAEIGSSVLADKVSTYDDLDRITTTVLRELPDVTFFYEELLNEPLSQNMERALVEAAGIAGRWSDLDPAVDQQLEVIDSRAKEVTRAPSVHAGDPAEAEMRYLDPDLQRATQALPRIERDNTVRAVRAQSAIAAESGAERGGVRERIQGWRDARREEGERTGDDAQRRREAWERGNGRSMHVTGTPSAAATADVVPAPAPERGLGR